MQTLDFLVDKKEKVSNHTNLKEPNPRRNEKIG